jgi:hypothetical protein
MGLGFFLTPVDSDFYFSGTPQSGNKRASPYACKDENLGDLKILNIPI